MAVKIVMYPFDDANSRETQAITDRTLTQSEESKFS